MLKISQFAATVLLATGSLWAQTQVQSQFDILNATSYQSSLAPGVVAVLLGEGITPGDEAGCYFSGQLGWSNNLRGVEVLVDEKPAPIGAFCRIPQADGLMAETVTCQLPRNLAPGEAEVVVRVNGQDSAPLLVSLGTHAPALAEFFTAGGLRIGAFQRVPSGELVSSDALAVPGEVLSILANGLGETAPEVLEGNVSPTPTARTVTTPTITIDGAAAELLAAALRPGYVGVYEVTFQVPPMLTTGFHRVRLTVGGVSSNEVLLPGGESTAPLIRSVVSSGGFAPNVPVAPGSLLSVFVSNVGGSSNTNLFPATEFDGISVDIGGTPAPLFAVVPESGQINLLAPLELPESGQAEVRIHTSNGAGGTFPLALASMSPGIFRVTDPTDPSRRFAAAMLGNTAWLAIPESVAEAIGLPVDCAAEAISPASHCGSPIRPGEILQVFLTGLGKATPGGDPSGAPLQTGKVAPADGDPLYQTVVLPEVTIGGLRAEVIFSGLAPGFAGLYQINLVVPPETPAGPAVALRVSTPNGMSDTALIAVDEP